MGHLGGQSGAFGGQNEAFGSQNVLKPPSDRPGRAFCNRSRLFRSRNDMKTLETSFESEYVLKCVELHDRKT